MSNFTKMNLMGFNTNESFMVASLVSAYMTKAPQNYSHSHVNENREFFYVSLALDGEIKYVNKKATIALKKNSLFFGSQAEMKSTGSEKGGHFITFYFHIYGYELPLNQVVEYEFNEEHITLTKRIINLLNSGNIFDVFEANLIFTSMLAKFLKHIAELNGPFNSFYKPIEESITYINQNICKEINVTSLATRHGYCEKHYRTLFKKFTGRNPKEYIMIKKSEYARKLLISTPLTVAEIAESLSYSTTSLFINHFKNTYNATPFEYRKNYPKMSVNSELAKFGVWDGKDNAEQIDIIKKRLTK